MQRLTILITGKISLAPAFKINIHHKFINFKRSRSNSIKKLQGFGRLNSNAISKSYFFLV